MCGNPVGRETEELERGSPEMVLRDEQEFTGERASRQREPPVQSHLLAGSGSPVRCAGGGLGWHQGCLKQILHENHA